MEWHEKKLKGMYPKIREDFGKIIRDVIQKDHEEFFRSVLHHKNAFMKVVNEYPQADDDKLAYYFQKGILYGAVVKPFLLRLGRERGRKVFIGRDALPILFAFRRLFRQPIAYVGISSFTRGVDYLKVGENFPNSIFVDAGYKGTHVLPFKIATGGRSALLLAMKGHEKNHDIVGYVLHERDPLFREFLNLLELNPYVIEPYAFMNLPPPSTKSRKNQPYWRAFTEGIKRGLKKI